MRASHLSWVKVKYRCCGSSWGWCWSLPALQWDSFLVRPRPGSGAQIIRGSSVLGRGSVENFITGKMFRHNRKIEIMAKWNKPKLLLQFDQNDQFQRWSNISNISINPFWIINMRGRDFSSKYNRRLAQSKESLKCVYALQWTWSGGWS